MAKRYTEEERTYIVALYQNGSTTPELCAKYGMSRSSLYGWIRQYSGGPAKTKSAREIYLLEKEIERLRITNKILIYNYLLRRPDKTMIQQQDEVLKPLILKIFEKSGRRFGARKIRAKLMENDYSERRTARLMKEMGLSSKAPRRNPNAVNDKEYKYYPNKLKRQFLQEAPKLVWVSDITYVRVGDMFYYLCIVIDLFSRKVLSYAISSCIDTELVTTAFENTEEELQTAVKEYIEYFNDYRPHQRMGFQTPNQVECDFYNNLQE